MTAGASAEVAWRSPFTNVEVHAMDADSFGTRRFNESE